MEICQLSSVDSREAYVNFTIRTLLLLTTIPRSGLWKEYTLVRRSQPVLISNYLLRCQLYDHKRYSLPTRQRPGLNGLFLLRF